jgi:hypothetical protein
MIRFGRSSPANFQTVSKKLTAVKASGSIAVPFSLEPGRQYQLPRKSFIYAYPARRFALFHPKAFAETTPMTAKSHELR